MDEKIENAERGLDVSVVDIEPSEKGSGPSSPRKSSRAKRHAKNCFLIFRQSFHRRNQTIESPWPKIARRGIYFLSGLLLIFVIVFTIHHAVLASLIRRLSPMRMPQTGLTQIVAAWVEPGTVTPAPPSWLPDFSRDVTPTTIHSHNDYWRQVPLFEALSLGITGVEADCHLIGNELYVGHNNASLRANRTLKSLYFDPLFTILTNQNSKHGIADNPATINGVWDVEPSRGLILMTDLKTDGASTLLAVQAALQPFREKGWLTYWNGSAIIPGPILHVGTGNTPFPSVLNSPYANSSYRDVFFDAPLDALTDDNTYNISNSYYTSTSLTQLFHGGSKIPHSGLTKKQIGVVQEQMAKAAKLGLVSRYWDIPAWPVEKRTKIWRQLEELGVGMLNADAIDVAARWNWKLCSVLGVKLC